MQLNETRRQEVEKQGPLQTPSLVIRLLPPMAGNRGLEFGSLAAGEVCEAML